MFASSFDVDNLRCKMHYLGENMENDSQSKRNLVACGRMERELSVLRSKNLEKITQTMLPQGILFAKPDSPVPATTAKETFDASRAYSELTRGLRKLIRRLYARADKLGKCGSPASIELTDVIKNLYELIRETRKASGKSQKQTNGAKNACKKASEQEAGGKGRQEA